MMDLVIRNGTVLADDTLREGLDVGITALRGWTLTLSC